MLVGELSRDVRPQRRVAFLSPVAVDGKASRGTWSRDLVTCRTHEQSLSLQRSAAEVTGDSTSWHEQQGQDRFSSFQVLSLFPPLYVCVCVCVPVSVPVSVWLCRMEPQCARCSIAAGSDDTSSVVNS